LAQAPQATAATANDPYAWLVFLMTHDKEMSHIRERRTREPQAAEAAERQAAAGLGLTVAQSESINQVYLRLKASLTFLDEAKRTHVKARAAAGQPPDDTTMRELTRSHRAAVEEALQSIRASLPAPAWQALGAHALRDIRKAVVNGTPGGRQ
jgi:hypothetical protein